MNKKIEEQLKSCEARKVAYTSGHIIPNSVLIVD